MAVNVAAARTLKVLSPLGVARSLFAIHAMALYPEQHLLRAAVSKDEYRRWVGRMCAGFAGNAAREIAAVRPGAEEFPEPFPRVAGPVTVIHSHLLGAAWDRPQREVSDQYLGSTRIFTGSLYHNIHLSRPDLIVDAVNDQFAVPQP